PNSTTGFHPADRLFVIGNGMNSGSRHNALTVLKNGNIGIGSDTPQSLLQVEGTATIQKAIISDSLQSTYLRMTSGAMNGGILQSDANGNGSWVAPLTLFSDDWSASGSHIYNSNSGNVGIGTTSPNYKLHVVGNVGIDAGRMEFVNTGASVFIGESAGEDDDLSNNVNVFIGQRAGQHNVSGVNNIAIGGDAMQQNISATDNISIGKSSLYSNASGNNNIAMGSYALSSNTSGSFNIGMGLLSLSGNGSGSSNVALGTGTMTGNSTGSGNIALNTSVLHNNTTGNANIGLGEYALFLNTTGSQNMAIGAHALESSMTGSSNVALGYYAGNFNSGSSNTMLGFESGKLNNGSLNVFLGYQAGYSETGSNKLYIENSNSTTPLIYGDFATNKVTVNDSLQSKFMRITNGAANGYLLKSDASGNALWSDPATIFSDDWNASGNNIYNVNTNNVGIGTSSPGDKLHIVGKVRIDGGKLSFVNTGQSVFIGEQAGQMDDLSNNNSVFIGYHAGQANTTGQDNIAIGASALGNTSN
ncbi:MAG TPA: hypothetical protein VJ508_07305, partial [Saprospiraceae bacterium]|nr:hypothetical protein [Saprospiraceae bacterium]